MLSATTLRRMLSCFGFAVALVAVYIVPTSIIHAQDFERVERRLGGMVQAGEITLEQAQVMLHALREFAEHKDHDEVEHHEMEQRKRHFMEVERVVKKAVERGELSYKDAEEKLNRLRHELFGHHEHEDHHAHEEHEKHEEHAEHHEGHKEHAEHHEDHEEHGDHDEDREMEQRERGFMQIEQRLRAAVERGELSPEEAEETLREMKERIFGGARRADDDDDEEESDEGDGELRRRLAGALTEAGVERGAVRPAMMMARRLAGQIVKQGDDFEMGAEAAEYLSKELGLNREQIGLVWKLAKYMASMDRDEDENEDEGEDEDERDEDRNVLREIVEALSEAGVSREAIRPAIGIARRLSGQIAEEGNNFELRGDTVEYLREELDLNREQIGVILRIAEHLAEMGDRERNEERQ